MPLDSRLPLEMWVFPEVSLFLNEGSINMYISEQQKCEEPRTTGIRSCFVTRMSPPCSGRARRCEREWVRRCSYQPSPDAAGIPESSAKTSASWHFLYHLIFALHSQPLSLHSTLGKLSRVFNMFPAIYHTLFVDMCSYEKYIILLCVC